MTEIHLDTYSLRVQATIKPAKRLMSVWLISRNSVDGKGSSRHLGRSGDIPRWFHFEVHISTSGLVEPEYLLLDELARMALPASTLVYQGSYSMWL